MCEIDSCTLKNRKIIIRKTGQTPYVLDTCGAMKTVWDCPSHDATMRVLSGPSCGDMSGACLELKYRGGLRVTVCTCVERGDIYIHLLYYSILYEKVKRHEGNVLTISRKINI